MSFELLSLVGQHVEQSLAFPTQDSSFHNQIAASLTQQPPSNEIEVYDMASEFFEKFQIDRPEAIKKCQVLFAHLKNIQGFLKSQKKSTEKKMQNQEKQEDDATEDGSKQEEFTIDYFGKKKAAHNVNTEITQWKKKDKKNKKKVLTVYEQHMLEIEEKSNELPPVIVRRQAEGSSKTNDLILEEISLIVGGKTLLDSTNVKLVYGTKYGLVGRNGIGKTCFMNALARNEFPKTPVHLQVLLVEQEIRNTAKTVINTVLETDVEREELYKQQEALSQGKSKESMVRLKQIFQRLEEIEAHKAESKAATILGGLGFTPEMIQKPIGSLSGGWRMRVALARALFVEPDILLLDEPTNHLDLDAVMWLEDYITTCNSTVVVVSHDREFLNVTCDEMIHFIDQKLVYYKGNYDIFEKLRNENRDRQNKQFVNQEVKIKHMQGFIDKFRANAKRASMVQSRIKSMNKMELVEEVAEDREVVFRFPTPDVLRPPLLSIEDGYFSYTEGGNFILKNASFAVDMESRIAIVGGNGVGKSTLLKLMVGTLELSEGKSYRNGKLCLSMFTQHHIDQLKMPLSPLEQFMTDFPGSTEEVYRAHLGAFGLTGNLALQPIYLMSGGQKSRVAFALSMWKNPHMLILDEPTNHLDIDAVNGLITALNNYSGGVIIVSHDQHLISEVCNEIWYIKDCKLVKYRGDFEDYRRDLSMGKL